jgi:hypothetical protein
MDQDSEADVDMLPPTPEPTPELLSEPLPPTPEPLPEPLPPTPEPLLRAAANPTNDPPDQRQLCYRRTCTSEAKCKGMSPQQPI